MMMKSRIFVLLLIAVCMVGCTESRTVREVKGAYRYKTTGKVTIQEHYEGATEADTLIANLDNESGTLELISLHNGDSLLMTIDQMNGNVIATRALVSEDGRLDFAPYTRLLEIASNVKQFDTIQMEVAGVNVDTVIVSERREYEPFDITVTGYADVYDNNLVFTLEYVGQSQTSERTMYGVDIKSLAKKN